MRFLFTLFGTVIHIFCHAPFLSAAHKPLKAFIERGSYEFKASYTLHTPLSASDLIINVDILRTTIPASLPGGLMCPEPIRIYLIFTLNNVPTTIEIHPQSNGKHTIIGIDALSSSVWHPELKKLAQKIGSKYYIAENPKKKIPHAIRNPSKTFLSSYLSIKPLQSYTLDTIDAIRFPPHLFHSHLPKSASVKVSIKVMKKRLIAIATYHTKNWATGKTSSSKITFIKTKNGIKEIAKKHIKCGQICYPHIKKITKKSMRQYIRFKQIHKKI